MRLRPFGAYNFPWWLDESSSSELQRTPKAVLLKRTGSPLVPTILALLNYEWVEVG